MDERDRMVETIRENAKIMESLTNGGKQPDPKTLLQHIPPGDDISENTSDYSELKDHNSKRSEFDGLNADVTEMEKIRSVGKSKLLIKEQ